MRRGLVFVLSALALASAFAVARTEAAVSESVTRLVRGEVQSYAKPSSATGRSRTASAMAALESTVVSRLNQVRRSRGLRPLRFNHKLRAAAVFHSRDMGRRGYFEHNSITGMPFWRRIERFYPSRGFRSWTVGENLLWGSDTYGAAFAVREWMNSPPHRANILSRDWREVGIGAVHFASAPGEYRGRGVTIVTADFGARG
jgi:uncharacterized protein YkwD